MSVVPRLRHGIAQDLRQLLLHNRTLGRRGKTNNTTPKEPSNSEKPCKKPLGVRTFSRGSGAFGVFWVSWVLRVPGLGLVSPGPKVGKCQARRGKGHCHEEYTDEAQDSSHHLFVVSGGLWGVELATPKPLNPDLGPRPPSGDPEPAAHRGGWANQSGHGVVRHVAGMHSACEGVGSSFLEYFVASQLCYILPVLWVYG